MTNTIPLKAATATTEGTTSRQGNLEYGFQVVTKPDEPQRDSFLWRDGCRQNIFNVQTAQKSTTPHLAIDLQPISRGSDSVDTSRDVVQSKLSDLPPALEKSGKGVLLIGYPNDYTQDEIFTLSNFSQSLPEGKFVVIAKTISSPLPSAQCWTTRTTGAQHNHDYEGFSADNLVSLIRQDSLS